MNGYSKHFFGGKDRGFKFDIKAIGNILKELEIGVEKLSEVMTNNPFAAYPVILTEGLKRNAEVSKSEMPDPEEVIGWIENDGILSEGVLNIIKAFSDSIVSLLPEAKQPKTKGKTEKK